ncbi:MAG TPA: DUF4440 domain-containing protein [Gemmatimonadales bacterium]
MIRISRRCPLGLLTLLAGLFSLVPSALPAQGAPQWAQDLLSAWYTAYNAGDAHGVARLYTEDAVVGTNRGRAAYAADLAARFAKVKATCTGAFDGFQVAGASAVGWGRDQCTETPKAGGPEVKTRTKWIAVYARQSDGRWLTVRDEGEPIPGASAGAEVAFSGSTVCRQTVRHAIPVPDQPGYQFVAGQGVCKPEGAAIAGVAMLEETFTGVDAVVGNGAEWRGRNVNTLANGDKIFAELECRTNLAADGSTASGMCRWRWVEGTGRFRGITGEGTSETGPTAGGMNRWTFKGTYRLP